MPRMKKTITSDDFDTLMKRCEELELDNAALFSNPREGKPAKSARMAIGALIIKKRYGLSDEDVVEEIRENPYLQYFLGFAEYTSVRPFDPSVMTWFRERITPQMLAEVNDYIIGHKKVDEDEAPPSDDDDTGDGEGTGNRGTLILDATCVPQNIRFPTDVSLLNEGRELLEKMIDTAHEAGAADGKKPRTYRNLARRDWLRFAR
ncbi:MAG: transposase, partial [Eubacteriales bacterium]|nr:transposase [Eubacteriales bacterium]